MADRQFVYVGTYTGGDSEGIYVYEMDGSTGALAQVADPMPAGDNPAFLDIHPNGTRLYAIHESGGSGGSSNGAVAAFAIVPEGKLMLINQQPSGGGHPCHVSVDPAGRAVFVANYGTGSVVMLPINDDGGLAEVSGFSQHEGSSVNPERQEGPHAHSITPSPDGRFVFAADLGIDKVLVYKVDYENGTLHPATQPWARTRDGAGPRHFAIHPTEKFAYVINELDSTTTAFALDALSGALTEIQTITTLPESFTDTNYPADIHVSADGRFLYGSNRGHDSIAIYAIGEASGMLTPVGHESTGGESPRNFGIDVTGRLLLSAHQDTQDIVSFHVDAESGRLTPTGHVTQVPSPVCLKFLQIR